MRLSLCMIVKDEEKNLPECLKHIRHVVDEIIVVDTGSKDNTPHIARQLGAKVFFFKWCDDFSAARNESLRHATGEYIIYLDADDRIDKENAEKIALLKKKLPSNKDIAYSLKIVLPSPNGTKNTAYQVRIFPNLPDVRFEQPIHEQIVPSLKRKGIKGVLTDIVIEHKGYEDEKILRKKAFRNLAILKRLLSKDQNNWFTHYFLAQTYEVLGERELCEIHLKKVMTEECKKTDENWFIGAGLKYCQLLTEMNRRKEAKDLLLSLEKEFPKNELIKFFIAEMDIEDGDYMSALNRYITINPEKLTLITIPVAEDNIRFKYYLNMGICYEMTEYYNLALNVYKDAYKIAFNDEQKKEVLLKIISVFTKMDKLKDAITYVEEYIKIDPSAKPYTLLALIYIKDGAYDKAETCLKKAISIKPNDHSLKIRLADVLIREGKLSDAKRLLKSLINRDIDQEEKITIVLMIAFIYISEFNLEEFLIATDLLLRYLKLKETVNNLKELEKVYEKLGKYLNDQHQFYINRIKKGIRIIDDFSAFINKSSLPEQLHHL